MRRTAAFVLILALSGLLGFMPAAAFQATPVATPITSEATLAAHGLVNPRGVTWDANGTLYVALSGVGGPNAGTVEAPVVHVVGTLYGGPSASVAMIENGCPVTVASGLASTRDEGGVTVGAAAVAFLNDQLYVLIAGGGVVHGNPDMPNGVYLVNADGSTTLVADFSAWIRANPVEKAGGPADYSPEGDPYAMVADPELGVLWVAEANSGQLLKIDLGGTITRVADFSAENLVPTALTLAPGGGVYVGFLTPVPFLDGTSKIVKIMPDGSETEVWTGLTMVSAVTVAPDGSLYALELSTGNTDTIPFMVPGSGKVLHQTGPDTAVEVATGLMLPAAMEFGPDGALYVVFPGIGANNGEGAILSFTPSDDTALTMADVTDNLPACAPIATPADIGTPISPPFDPATPQATPVS